MRFAAGLRTQSADPTERKQRTVDLAPTWRQGRAYGVGWDYDRAVREGYDRVVWVMRCVNAIADSWAGLPIGQRQGNRETGAFVDNPHETVELLNAFPNDYEEGEIFRQALAAQFLLSRAGAFVEYVRARNGDVFALNLLPPGRTKPVPGSGGRFLEGFEIDLGGGNKLRLPPVGDGIDHGIVWVRTRHPNDPYSSFTPLEAAGLAVDTDWMARLYSRNFLRNDARPPMVIGVSGGVTPEGEAEIRSRLSPGPDSAGRFAIIETAIIDDNDNVIGPGGGITVHDLGKTPRDAEWVELRKLGKDEILGAFNAPESVVAGKASDRTFENARQERINFKLDTCRQNARRVLSPFDRLDPRPDRFLAVDWSSDPDVQAAEEARRKARLEEVKERVLTPNEFRAEDGKDPLEGGDAVWGPVSIGPLYGDVPELPEPEEEPEDEPEEPVAPVIPIPPPVTNPSDVAMLGRRNLLGNKTWRPSPAPAGAKGSLGLWPRRIVTEADLQPHGMRCGIDDCDHVFEVGDVMALRPEQEDIYLVICEDCVPDGKTRKRKQTVTFGPFDVDESWIAREKQAADRRLTAWERQVERLVRRFFRRQERVVLERLAAARTLRGTRHWEGEGSGGHKGKGDKLIDPARVFDIAAWDAELIEDGQAWALSIIEDYGEEVLSRVRAERSLGNGHTKQDEAGFDASDPRVIEALESRRNRLRNVNDVTWRAVRDEIIVGEREGETVRQIADRIRGVFSAASKTRAVTIARTEVISAANEGSLIGARQSGVAERKLWLATSDDRTRDTHAGADGQTVGIEEPFNVGGAALMFPGDPAGPAREVIQCRCTMLFGTAEGVL